ncbi:ankyrin repeat-containing domain protein [Corynascus novoguineensis]|uniref:Ankyrin repeat-containing domain protein n=1 Tax=Corynascus novoguineensis TaxID=1126955 RepID=A0AAN7CUY3_9PEZI|nr:ankyrin repeat-containing domain protein [Corynascus novoguineensis]
MDDELIQAVVGNDLDEVKKLLEAGHDVNVKDEYYEQTAISWAAELDHLEVAKALYNKGADIRLADIHGQSPVHWAAMKSERVLSIFLECEREDKSLSASAAEDGPARHVKRSAKVDFDSTDEDGRTPLMAAARDGRYGSVHALLKVGADPQVYDKNCKTPLYLAAWNGHIDVMRELVKTGANPYELSDPPREDVTAFVLAATADDAGWKAYLDTKSNFTAEEHPVLGLHHAARHGFPKIVERMVSAGSGVDARDDMGRTPLIWASINGHVSVVQLLLSIGANAKLSDNEYKETALMWAAEHGHAEIVELLSPKSDVNAPALGWRGFTALTFAVWNKHPVCMEALIKAGADLNAADEKGLSPLSWAAKNRHLDAVKIMIKAGADLYSESLEGRTALYFASRDRDIVQAFIEERRETTMGADEKLPRVRAIELALRHACEDLPSSDETGSGSKDTFPPNDENGSEILGFILDQTKYLEAVDHDNGNLVSWAAQGGNSVEMAKLCTRKVNLELSDVDKRTPLHWAAQSGNSRVAKCLLINGVKPDSRDKEQRTPLSLAAEAGHIEVVKVLLSFRYGSVGAKVDDAAVGRKKVPERANIKAGDTVKKDKLHNEDGKAAKLAGNKKGGVIVEIDSQDSSGQTPLWYAATKQHRAIFAELLASGASPAIKDSKGRSLQNVLEEELYKEQESLPVQAREALEAMVKKLGSSEALWTGPRQETIKTVDAGFRATVVSVHKGNQSDIRLQSPTVDSLLEGHDLPELQGMKWAWIHLPANNMRWVLMAKHYEACGERHGWNSSVVLQSSHWEQQQHRSRDHHARFMRPACHSFTLHRSSPTRGMVLFMPYLHWELQSQHTKLNDITKTPGKRESYREDIFNRREKNLSNAEKLYSVYLDEEHPLHVRRTLDQFYYHTLPDTKERDNDQTGIRYYEGHGLRSQSPGLEPILTMVDELWMWVLPACAEKPPIIITAFPQRSERSVGSRLTALVSNIIDQIVESSERPIRGLAQAIVAECSKTYFDPTSNRNGLLQFSEIYETSIGDIAERETRRFLELKENIQKPGSQSPDPAFDKNRTLLNDSLDIITDIEDLRQIKDIRDELNIILSVFHQQNKVVQAMTRTLREINIEQSSPANWPTTANPIDSMSYALEDGNAKKAYNLTLPAVVGRSIDEVKRLDHFAERTAKAIEQLLDLKHKQANLALTKGIYKINDGTDRQGKTIMYFTVATIIFLPLSFMASFLTIEVDEFPRGTGGKLSLDFVLKVIFAVSVTLIVPSVIVAFNLDHKSRRERVQALKSAVENWRMRPKQKPRDIEHGGSRPTEASAQGDEAVDAGGQKGDTMDLNHEKPQR